jgi:catalase
MPLPTDDKLISTAKELLGLFHGAFGPHPGYRPAHAKGQLLSGTFTPTAEAKSLTTAPQFNKESTPVIVRFSNSTGLPEIPDNDGNSVPKGFAVRFNLGLKDGKRQHTDIIGHSTPHFPVHNGEEFVEFLKALGGSPPGTPSPSPIEQFLGSHPAALTFVQAPKPFPVSFGTESYFALNAFKFINADGKETYLRYQIIPDAGLETLSADDAKAKGPNYLFEELPDRLKSGLISFKIVAQLANEGDPTDDITQQWPDDRKTVVLGTIKLDSLVEDSVKEQKITIFDPIPRVEGIEPSADPILEFRAGLYLLSGRERRAA